MPLSFNKLQSELLGLTAQVDELACAGLRAELAHFRVVVSLLFINHVPDDPCQSVRRSGDSLRLTQPGVAKAAVSAAVQRGDACEGQNVPATDWNRMLQPRWGVVIRGRISYFLSPISYLLSPISYLLSTIMVMTTRAGC